jgi:hypothetical protein
MAVLRQAAVANPSVKPTAARQAFRTARADGETIILSQDQSVASVLSESEKNSFSCSSWQTFRAGALSSAYASKIVKAVSVAAVQGSASYPYYPLDGSIKALSCFEESAADAIVASVAGGTSANVTCNGTLWHVQPCASATGSGGLTTVALCVGPECLVGSALCDAAATAAHPFPVVAPCSSAGSGSGLSALQADFRDVTSPPDIVNITLPLASQRERTAIQVSVGLSSGPGSGSPDGSTVLCVASAIDRPVPASMGVFDATGSSMGITAGTTAAVRITGLVPASAYHVFCAAVSTENVRSSLVDVLSASQLPEGQGGGYITSNTSCCRDVTAVLSRPIFNFGTAYRDAGSISISHPPSASITVMLYAQGSSKYATWFVPGSIEFSPQTPLTQTFSVAAYDSVTGALKLLANISGPSAYEFQTTKTPLGLLDDSSGGSGTFEIADPTTPMPPPALLSAIFEPDGVSVLVTLTAPCDRGFVQGSQEPVPSAGATQSQSLAQAPHRALDVIGSFRCDLLLAFRGAATAGCQWVRSDVVQVTPAGADADKVRVGDAVSLRSSTDLWPQLQLRAACDSPATLASCSSWVAADLTAPALTTLAPVAPTPPSISLNGPSTLGQCTPLQLDLSESAGSGGRTWNATRVTVSLQSKSGSYNSTLAALLQVHLATQGPSPQDLYPVVPAQLLEAGVTYTFDGQVTSFLGTVSGALPQRWLSVNVRASVEPEVSFAGGSTVSMRSAKQALSVQAIATWRACGGVIRTDGLTYSFSLWQETTAGGATGATPLALRSASNNPSVFSLAAYSLVPRTDYRLRVRVDPGSNGVSTEASMRISVGSGELRALIADGPGRVIRPTDVLVLDGSGSSDTELKDLTGVAAGLSFAWQCTQVSQPLSASCPSLDLPAQLSGTEKLTVRYNNASVAPVGTVSVLTLVVSSSAGGISRVASTTVQITTLEADAPQVFTSVPTGTNVATFNRGQRLVVFATSSLQTPGYVRWGLQLADGRNASLAALQPTTAFKGAGDPFARPVPAGTLTTSLVFPPNALAAGETYRFTFNAVLASGLSSDSFVIVHTNRPPQPGSFTGSPTSGQEMTTRFTLECRSWADPDGPISYTFFAIESFPAAAAAAAAGSDAAAVGAAIGSAAAQGAARLTLSDSAPQPRRTELLLPIGAAAHGHKSPLAASVSDSLGATAWVGTTVEVTALGVDSEGNTNTDSSERLELVAASLSTALAAIAAPEGEGSTSAPMSPGESSATKSIVSATTAAVNAVVAVNCTPPATLLQQHEDLFAPGNFSCSAVLRRQVCSSHAHTCGPCLESHPVGQEGHANTRCASQAEVDSNIIAPEKKRCPADCSGHGSCYFMLKNHSMVPFSDFACYTTSGSSCMPKCMCSAGYLDADCSTTEAERLAQKNIRASLATSFIRASQIDDASEAQTSNILSLLNGIVAKPAEVSSETRAEMLSLTSSKLNTASDSSVPFDSTQLAPLVGVLDVVSASEGGVPSSLEDSRSAIGLVTAQIMGGTVTGTPNDEAEGDNFCVTVGAQTPITSQGVPVSASVPARRRLESSSSEEVVSVGIQGVGNGPAVSLHTGVSGLQGDGRGGLADIEMGIYIVNPFLAGAGLNRTFLSPPLTVQLAKVACSADNPVVNVTAVMKNPRGPESYGNVTFNFITTCVAGVAKNVIHDVGGQNITVPCDGIESGSKFGSITKVIHPVCDPDAFLSPAQKLAGGGSGRKCWVESYDALSTTCVCELCNINTLDSSQRRRLYQLHEELATVTSMQENLYWAMEEAKIVRSDAPATSNRYLAQNEDSSLLVGESGRGDRSGSSNMIENIAKYLGLRSDESMERMHALLEERRNLVDQKLLAGIGVMEFSTAVVTSFNNLILSQQALSDVFSDPLSVLRETWIISVIMGSAWALPLILLLCAQGFHNARSYQKSREEKKREEQQLKERQAKNDGSSAEFDAFLADENYRKWQILTKPADFFDQIIPEVYQLEEHTPWSHALPLCIERHSLFSLFTEGGAPTLADKLANVFEFSTVVIGQLYALALVTDIALPTDDGSCDLLTSEVECYRPTSLLDSTLHRCEWTGKSPVDGICEWHDLEISMRLWLIILLVSIIFTAPIQLFFIYFFTFLVKAPTQPLEQRSKVLQARRKMEETLGVVKKNKKKYNKRPNPFRKKKKVSPTNSFDEPPDTNESTNTLVPSMASIYSEANLAREASASLNDAESPVSQRRLRSDVGRLAFFYRAYYNAQFVFGSMFDYLFLGGGQAEISFLHTKKFLERTREIPEQAVTARDQACALLFTPEDIEIYSRIRAEGAIEKEHYFFYRSHDTAWHDFESELLAHRKTLPTIEELEEFDDRWGILTHGADSISSSARATYFGYGDPSTATGSSKASSLSGDSSAYSEASPGVIEGLDYEAFWWPKKRDLQTAMVRCLKRSAKTIRMIEENNFSDEEIGFEVVHAFMLDLLGQSTWYARIFDQTSHNQFGNLLVLTRWLKVLVIGFVVVANLWFYTSTIALASRKNEEWLWAYAELSLWMCIVEIMLVQTTEAVSVGYYMPMLVRADVTEAVRILKRHAASVLTEGAPDPKTALHDGANLPSPQNSKRMTTQKEPGPTSERGREVQEPDEQPSRVTQVAVAPTPDNGNPNCFEVDYISDIEEPTTKDVVSVSSKVHPRLQELQDDETSSSYEELPGMVRPPATVDSSLPHSAAAAPKDPPVEQDGIGDDSDEGNPNNVFQVEVSGGGGVGVGEESEPAGQTNGPLVLRSPSPPTNRASREALSGSSDWSLGSPGMKSESEDDGVPLSISVKIATFYCPRGENPNDMAKFKQCRAGNLLHSILNLYDRGALRNMASGDLRLSRAALKRESSKNLSRTSSSQASLDTGTVGSLYAQNSTLMPTNNQIADKGFSASTHLFISHRIAEHFQHLFESQVVLSYEDSLLPKTFWLSRFGRHIHQGSTRDLPADGEEQDAEQVVGSVVINRRLASQMGDAHVDHRMSLWQRYGLPGFARWAAAIPVAYQRLLCDTLAPVVFGLIMLLISFIPGYDILVEDHHYYVNTHTVSTLSVLIVILLYAWLVHRLAKHTTRSSLL